MLENLRYEIELMKKSPIFEAYVKFKTEYAEGQRIENLINGKMLRFNKLVAELQRSRQPVQEEEDDEVTVENEEEEAEELPVKQLPKKQEQQLKQNLRQNRVVSPAREAEINKKVADNPFEAEAEDLGLNDDIPGLPDNLDD